MLGCKTIGPSANENLHFITFRIQSNGNVYSRVMDIVTKQPGLLSVKLLNGNFLMNYFEQIEVEMDWLNGKQIAELQKELLRVPGIFAMTIL